MIPVKVIYPKGNLGAEGTTIYSIEVDAPVDVEDADWICDQAFRMMNRVDGSEIEHYLDRFGCRSMSVGDLIQLSDGRTFRCEAIGWKEIVPSLNFSKQHGLRSTENS
jgi:hypothetical protein